ncbi:MAG TPA: hypothetical protein VMS74_08260 [Acidimicrobiia bacterium]|nr:hypothetical protein [Acidimicrobiia bacterium]
MIERVLVLGAVIGVALALVSAWERSRPRRLRVSPGITVFTGPDCRLCPSLLGALDAAGAVYRTVDVAARPMPGVRSLPTVLVADAGGVVALRRSGRSAVADIDLIIAVAATGGSIKESA